MNFIRTIQYNKRCLKLYGKASVLCFHSFSKINFPSKFIFARKQLPIFRSRIHLNIDLTIIRLRYSFVQSSKPFYSINSIIFRSSSSDKQAPNIGTISNEEIPLTKSQADDLILRLTEDERKALLTALQEYNSNQVKAEYEGKCYILH